MTIEEYRDKHFEDFKDIIFYQSPFGDFACYHLNDYEDCITLYSDGCIGVDLYCDIIIDPEMMSDLKKLIRTDKNFKEWRKRSE